MSTAQGQKKTKKQMEQLKEKRKTELLGGMQAGEHLILHNKLELQQRSIDGLNLRVQDLLHDNQQLEMQVRDLELKNNIYVNDGEVKQRDKQEQITRLRGEIKSMRERFDDERFRVVSKYEKQINELKADLREAQREIEERNQEKGAIDQWRNLRDKMTRDLQDLRVQLEEERKHHKDEILVIRREQQLERQQMSKELEVTVRAEKQKATEEAEANQDKTVRQILTINAHLQEEAKNNEVRATETNEKNQVLMEKNQQLMRDQGLNTQMQEHSARKSQRQTKVIRELNRKVTSLETALSSVVRDFDTERGKLMEGTSHDLAEAHAEVEALQRLLEIKNKELRTIKKSAQTILDARTEMEQFFLESIALIKEERLAEKKRAIASEKKRYNQAMTQGISTGSFPVIRSYQGGHVTKRADKVGKDQNTFITDLASDVSTERVDIGELSWDERERVMRLMFARMNGTEIVLPSSVGGRSSRGPSSRGSIAGDLL